MRQDLSSLRGPLEAVMREAGELARVTGLSRPEAGLGQLEAAWQASEINRKSPPPPGQAR